MSSATYAAPVNPHISTADVAASIALHAEHHARYEADRLLTNEHRNELYRFVQDSSFKRSEERTYNAITPKLVHTLIFTYATLYGFTHLSLLKELITPELLNRIHMLHLERGKKLSNPGNSRLADIRRLKSIREPSIREAAHAFTLTYLHMEGALRYADKQDARFCNELCSVIYTHSHDVQLLHMYTYIRSTRPATHEDALNRAITLLSRT